MKLGAAMIVKGNADLGPALRSLYAVLPHTAPLSACVDMRWGRTADFALGEAAESLDIPVYEDVDGFMMWTPSCIHFAANRNRSIDLCPADWIFILDADETVEGPLLEAVAKADEAGVNALYVARHESVGDTPTRVYSELRAFRKGAMRYQHPVHNQPLWLGEKTAHHDPRVIIRADYPADDPTRLSRSYPALLKLWREEDPHGTDRNEQRGHAAFFLAKMNVQRKRWAKAFRWALRCVNTDEERRGYAEAWRILAESSLYAHGVDNAFGVADAATRTHPENPDLWRHRIRLDAIKLIEALGKAGPLDNSVTAKYAPNLQQAFDLLGLGLQIGGE